MVGAVASVMVAVAVAFLLELLNPVVRSARQMERETGLRPVVSIPMVDTSGRGGITGRWKRRREAGQRGRAARRARKLRQG